MIKANELRVGNWVYGTDGAILPIDKQGFYYVLNYPNNNQLEGIYITPEILDNCEQFGRMVIHGEDCFFNGDDIIVRGNDMYLFIHNEVDGSVWGIRRIEHVHQLQNLYFALTGKELELK